MIREIIVTNQKEFDALPSAFTEYTRIIIRDTTECVYVAVARDNSSVEARGNSSVEARGNSSVVAWGNSSVVARDNSSVVARDNSSVVARDNSSVVARDNSSVEAWGNVGVHLFSDSATVFLFMFAVCWRLAKGMVKKKSKTATLIESTPIKGKDAWFKTNCVDVKANITLFKRVSKDFKTQERTNNETLWEIGKTLTHPSWKPETDECGEGKYHACSRAFFCDEFRSGKGDRYIAVEVEKKDLYAWPDPQYPHKIAFRKGKVLHEVTRFGKKI